MTIQELREKRMAINNQIAKLVQAKREIQDKLKDTIQASFEAEHGVKPGDIIKTQNGEALFYDGVAVSKYDNIILLCHPAKKDGTTSKFVRYMRFCDF